MNRDLITWTYRILIGAILIFLVSVTAWSFARTPEAEAPPIPQAQPATPVPMTMPPDPTRCVEDEARIDYPNAVTVCLHREGDGWRVIDTPS
jgi:hypothetical protein